MKTVKISIHAIGEGDKVSGSLATERRRGQTWVRESVVSMVTGDPSAERTMILEDDQRISFEGSTERAAKTQVPPPKHYTPTQSAKAAPVDMTKGPQATPLPYREDDSESLVDKAIRQDEEARRKAAMAAVRPAPVQPRPITPAVPPMKPKEFSK